MTIVANTPWFRVCARVSADTVLVLTGELDLVAVEPVEEVLAEIDLGAVRHLTLDLRPLTFIDAMGMRTVFRVYDVCREHGIVLTVRRGPGVVHRVFELTGTDRLLPFEAA